jgi:hypothetical protein
LTTTTALSSGVRAMVVEWLGLEGVPAVASLGGSAAPGKLLDWSRLTRMIRPATLNPAVPAMDACR